MNKNLLTNYAASALTALSQLAAIPAYLAFLGPSGWGKLSTVLSWAATLLILEAGISLSLSRAFSFGQSSDGTQWPGILRLERRYALVAGGLLVAAAVAFFAPADHSASGAQQFAGSNGIAVVALLLASAQLLGAPYRGILIGSGNQVAFNKITVASLLFRLVFSISIAQITRSVTWVTICIAGSIVLEAAARRAVVKHIFCKSASTTSTASLTRSFRPSRGMLLLGIASVAGAMNSQLDRLLLSTKVPVTTMGGYAIASTLSLAVIQLAHPLSQALIPKMPSLTERLIVTIYKVLGASFVVLWGIIYIYGAALLKFWAPSADVSGNLYQLFVAHVFGSTINVFCVPLHLLLLSRHNDLNIAVVNAAALGAALVTFYSLFSRIGVFAGAAAWVASNIIIFVGYFMATYGNKRFA